MLDNVVLTLHNNNDVTMNVLTSHFREKKYLFFEVAIHVPVFQDVGVCSIAVMLNNVVLTLYNDNVNSLNDLNFHFRKKIVYFLRLLVKDQFSRALDCALPL